MSRSSNEAGASVQVHSAARSHAEGMLSTTVFISALAAAPAAEQPEQPSVEVRTSMTDEAFAGQLARGRGYGTHLRLEAMGTPRPSWQARHVRTAKRPHAALRFGGTFGMDATTPTDIRRSTIDEDDRPYVGYTYAGFIVEFTDGERNRLRGELDYGAIGAQSGAGAFHRAWKGAIGPRPQGWSNQVRDELHFNLVLDWDRALVRGFEFDGFHLVEAQTHARVELAELAVAGSVGGTVRLGYLQRPFVGVPSPDDARLDSCRSWRCRVREGAQAFVYLRGDVGSVWRRTSIDGSLFDRPTDHDRSPHRSDARPVVGTAEVGVVLQPLHNLDVRFAVRHISAEVDAPSAAPHVVGHGSVGVRF